MTGGGGGGVRRPRSGARLGLRRGSQGPGLGGHTLLPHALLISLTPAGDAFARGRAGGRRTSTPPRPAGRAQRPPHPPGSWGHRPSLRPAISAPDERPRAWRSGQAPEPSSQSGDTKVGVGGGGENSRHSSALLAGGGRRRKGQGLSPGSLALSMCLVQAGSCMSPSDLIFS